MKMIRVLKSRYPEKKLLHKTSIGLTGMEKSFDEFLLPDGEAKLVFMSMQVEDLYLGLMLNMSSLQIHFIQLIFGQRLIRICRK